MFPIIRWMPVWGWVAATGTQAPQGPASLDLKCVSHTLENRHAKMKQIITKFLHMPFGMYDRVIRNVSIYVTGFTFSSMTRTPGWPGALNLLPWPPKHWCCRLGPLHRVSLSELLLKVSRRSTMWNHTGQSHGNRGSDSAIGLALVQWKQHEKLTARSLCRCVGAGWTAWGLATPLRYRCCGRTASPW